MMKDTDRLLHTSHSRSDKQQMTYTTIAPEVFNLRRKLEDLVNENKHLCSQARSFGGHHNTSQHVTHSSHHVA